MPDVSSPPAYPVTLGWPFWNYATWRTPSKEGVFPCILLLPPLAATTAHMAPLADWLCQQGWAVLCIDFMCFGRSPGRVRHQLNLTQQCFEIASAHQWLSTHPQVNTEQIVHWGVSLSASHLLTSNITAFHPAATVLQTPFVCGKQSLAKSINLRHLQKLQQKRPNRHMPLINTNDQGILPGASATNFYGRIKAYHARITLASLCALCEHSVIDQISTLEYPPKSCWLIAEQDQIISPSLQQAAFKSYPNADKQYFSAKANHFSWLLEPEQSLILKKTMAWLSATINIT